MEVHGSGNFEGDLPKSAQRWDAMMIAARACKIYRAYLSDRAYPESSSLQGFPVSLYNSLFFR